MSGNGKPAFSATRLVLGFTFAVGLTFVYFVWREAQKPDPEGDNPPVHSLCAFVFFSLWTSALWITDRRRRPRP